MAAGHGVLCQMLAACQRLDSVPQLQANIKKKKRAKTSKQIFIGLLKFKKTILVNTALTGVQSPFQMETSQPWGFSCLDSFPRNKAIKSSKKVSVLNTFMTSALVENQRVSQTVWTVTQDQHSDPTF